MPEVTQDLMYRLLKRMHSDISGPKQGRAECDAKHDDLDATRTFTISTASWVGMPTGWNA